MKYTMMLGLYGRVFSHFLTASGTPPALSRAVRQEYAAILKRAGDIGSDNPLLTSYALAAFFLSMNRHLPGTPEENLQILDSGLRSGKLVTLVLGDADHYLSPKKMPGRQKWSAQTHEKRYPNDWVVDVLPAGDGYELGYNYLECGACKLCRDEGQPELAKYLCRLDYTLTELMGVCLTRTSTLADGGDLCDFRFSRPDLSKETSGKSPE